jgi:hypothetical protein
MARKTIMVKDDLRIQAPSTFMDALLTDEK